MKTRGVLAQCFNTRFSEDKVLLANMVILGLSAAGLAIVPREITPEIEHAYLNIQDPRDVGVRIEQHWRVLVAAAEADQ